MVAQHFAWLREAGVGVVISSWWGRLSIEEKAQLVRGADEIDLVNSGLEDTMINAYDNIREVMHSTDGVDTLRVAAFILAINRVAVSYGQLGIFP